MIKKYKVLVALSFLLLTTGCTLIDPHSRPDTKKNIIRDVSNGLTTQDEEVSYVEDSSREEMIEDLSSYVVDTAANVEQITNIGSLQTGRKRFNIDLMVVKKHFDHKKVKISIEEMPLNKFLNLVFSKVLKVDYILDKKVQSSKQPVSINIKKEISKQKLFSIVSNMLEGFNIAIDLDSNIFYIKTSKKIASESVHKVYFGTTLPRGLSDNDVIYMMRPFFYNKQMSKHNIFIQEYFLSKKADLRIDEYDGVIKIRDRVKNIRKALEYYNFIDQPSMRNKEMKLIRMENMEVDKFIDALKPILKNYGILLALSPKSPGVQIVPIRQINAFLLLSEKKSWTDTVLFWKKKLDIVKVTNMNDLEFFVYNPLNRKAEELVEVIRNFSSVYETSTVGNGGTNPLGETASGELGGVSTGIPSDNNFQSNLNQSSNQTKVVLDKERNNIIIYAKRKEYLALKKMLRRLDTLPKQVLIEVTIADISLTNSLKYGFEWFLTKNGYNVKGLDGGGSSGAAGLLANMFSLSKGLDAVFSAAETRKYVNILSNPKILVLNNHSASINVGDRIPIISSQASVGDLGGAQPTILQNIQYQETGISLAVKPTINSDGYLTLNIVQNVSNSKSNNLGGSTSPIIFNRALQTDVILKSGETVVLGGLISEDKTQDETKIPFLGDIPFLKHLFSNSGDSIEKKELVILIKPTILRNSNDAKIVTDALLELVQFR